MMMVAAITIIAAALTANRPIITYDAAAQSVSVRRLGVAAHSLENQRAASRALQVYLGESQTAMLGDYRLAGEVLTFLPRFPLLADRDYRVVVDLSAVVSEAKPIVYQFRTGAAPFHPRTYVTAIFPSTDVVPANLLRMYIFFSGSMSRQNPLDHIRLVDDRGHPVQQAFLETKEGLWDREGRRLTLFFDPGRIKSGVGVHERLGLALQPGGCYRVIVSKDAVDVEGLQLRGDFIKKFCVVPEDHTSPNIDHWKIRVPLAQTRNALVVDVGKPLDHALFERLVRVEDSHGVPVRGTAAVENQDARWLFVPETSWRAGEYSIRVAGALEDLAGNRPTRLFEEIATPNGRRAEASDAVVSFQLQ
jgi:hypothetical protein